jgi:hypothetical protein
MSGGVSSFVSGLKKDKEETYKRMDLVTDKFEVFNTNTTKFETFRDELYTEVLSNVYYDTMYSEDEAIKNKLSNYESLVDDLEKNASKLDKLCDDVYYPDSSINSKCTNYKSIYEQVVNYFVTDIKLYNKNVKTFNEYQANNNSSIKIKEYKTSKDYIDYNNDKVFDGKEE